MDKSPWTHLQKEKSPKQNFKRKNLLNKSSKDKSPWTHLQRIDLLNRSSKEKSLEQIFKGKVSWTNLQWTNVHEHILKRKNLLNKSSMNTSSKEKSPEQIFKNNSKSQIVNSKFSFPRLKNSTFSMPNF